MGGEENFCNKQQKAQGLIFIYKDLKKNGVSFVSVTKVQSEQLNEVEVNGGSFRTR